jgi:hypothetical protein
LKARAALAVALVCLAAFLLRLHGLGFGLPHVTYRDGMVIYTQVKEMRTGDRTLRQHEFWGYYPQVTSRVASLLPDESFEPQTEALDLDATLDRFSRPWRNARVASVLLSLGAVLGAYLVARRFLPVGPSLFAAALVATSLLHVSFSQQEKPHGPISGTVALAVAAALHLRSTKSTASYLLAVAAAMVALGTLQSGAFALGALEVACLVVAWTSRGGAERAPWWASRLGVFVLLAAVAVTIRVLYPFHFIDRPEAAREPGSEDALDLAGHPVFLGGFDFTGGITVLSTLWHYDPTMLVLIAAGLVLAAVHLAKGRRPSGERALDLAVVLGFVAPFLLVLLAYRWKVLFERFTMPLIPFYAVFAAWAGWRLVERLKSPRARIAAALVALALPSAAAWKLTSVRATPDASAQVAHWIREHVEPGERVHVFPLIDLPLFYDERAVQEAGGTAGVLYWLALQRAIPEELRLGPRHYVVQPRPAEETLAEYRGGAWKRLVELGTRYVVITGATEKMRDPTWTALERDLERRAELVFRVAPLGEDRGQLNIRYSQRLDAVPFLVHLFRASCMGNTLEVYRLPRDERGEQ